jgi:DNA-binding response OmpR family regulator
MEVMSLTIDQLYDGPYQYHFDLSIVDMLADNAEEACNCINDRWHLPLILIVKHQQADWEQLEVLEAYGYISDTFSKSELIARLAAIARRYQQNAIQNSSEVIQAS